MPTVRTTLLLCFLALPSIGCDGAPRTPDASDDSAAEDGSFREPDAGTDGGPRTCGTWGGRASIRALFIGNSQIDFWDLPQLVGDISESGPSGCPRIVGERFTAGGANLQNLWDGADGSGRRLEPLIASGDYDVVVIAESIDLVDIRPEFPGLFIEYATRIIDASLAAGSVPILYATPWIEIDDDRAGFRAQADPQIELGRERSVTVAAGGLAWLRVWAELPDVDLYYSDRSHPGHKGSYISALVIYSAITGASPIGLTYTPPFVCEDGPCSPITADEADVFQRAAWDQHLETGL